MIRLNRLTTLFLVFATLTISAHATNNGEDESFEELSEKLEKAIEVRNFHIARETIEELMPLMKQELKDDKKYLSGLKKKDEPDVDPEAFKKKLNRKTELYDSLKKLVKVSPAALRVKSELIRKEVQEFIELS